MDNCQISYVLVKEEDGILVLRPMVEYFLKDKLLQNVYQLDLTTKGVFGNIY